jgi:tRNA (guanine-N7-)-methyltransferase
MAGAVVKQEAMEERSNGREAFLERRKARIGILRNELERRFPLPCPLVLEFGCGHGHFLTGYARAHPEQHCLGIDVVSRRIRLAERKRDKAGLERLHFLKAEAREFLEALPEGLLLERVFMLFPDPWPKKRHHKKRMVQADFLAMLAGAATPTATFHFRSDHEDNFLHALATVAASRDWEVDDALPWPFETPSWFQELLPDYASFSARRF